MTEGQTRLHRQAIKLPRLIVILGPTASGKSALAVVVAKKFHGELVSADSRQIYQGMDIGTAKLRPPRGVRQWLVDLVPPISILTLEQYQQKAFAAIKDIHRRGKLPIVVGGTGLYIDAVVDNLNIPKVAPNKGLRAQFERIIAKQGLPALVRKLKRLDLVSAKTIDIKNPRRVIRALEVAMTSGRSFVTERRQGTPQYRVLKIGLNVSRADLRQRLRRRTERMIRDGLLLETRRLTKKYSMKLPALSGIGYHEAILFLRGDINRSELVERIAQRSVQYVKRQMTWWRRDKNIIWIKDTKRAVTLIRQWLKTA